jgi:branched-chain amino acid transport system permease protein
MVLLLMYVTMTESWNMLSGYTGYTSLGHSVFFGVGCYTFALAVVKLKVGYILALIMSGLIPAVLALIIGFILMSSRIRIAYFAVMTLGLNEIVKTIVANSEALGSSYGFTLPPMPTLSLGYYVCLILAISSILVTIAIERSKFGIGLMSILEDEEVADSIGVNTSKYKIYVFVLSSIFPGFLGAIIAWNWSYIDPYLAFDLTLSIDAVMMGIFGGVGTVWGPVIGSICLTIIIELLWVRIPYFHAIIFSLLVIFIVIKAPGGLIKLAEQAFSRLTRRGSRPYLNH